MLAAEFTFAVAPASVGYDGGNALVDAGGVDRDRAAEAGTDRRDTLGRDRRVPRQERERVTRIFHLFEANHSSVLAFALAAAAHVEAQRDVTQLVKNLAGCQHVL